ncbi:MAG: redox-sensing transcriptional repressor Rex [Clostridia bacterium]|nr:redox-sensing transcriptional repressor Rex [Clostridia bacterium]
MTVKKSDKKEARIHKPSGVSPVVIRRLPRYFRYLRELLRAGRMRISSGELSAMMHVTASQIRQDLNCFGGFGQQGYGYNVSYLYTKICELLGVEEGYRAVIIGAGHLGKALVRNSMFEKRGVEVVSLFDVAPDVVGTEVGDIPVLHMDALERFCEENVVDIAVLTLPKDQAEAVAKRLISLGVRGLWNFTGKELNSLSNEVVVENVHIGDSLMTLCYKLNYPNGDGEEKV